MVLLSAILDRKSLLFSDLFMVASNFCLFFIGVFDSKPVLFEQEQIYEILAIAEQLFFV